MTQSLNLRLQHYLYLILQLCDSPLKRGDFFIHQVLNSLKAVLLSLQPYLHRHQSMHQLLHLEQDLLVGLGLDLQHLLVTIADAGHFRIAVVLQLLLLLRLFGAARADLAAVCDDPIKSSRTDLLLVCRTVVVLVRV